jgi:tRNA(fMet)-specific endonuclease VapC
VIHLDTSFLIDVVRERHRRVEGRAVQCLLSFGDDVDLAVSVHAICELLAGAERARRPMHERRQIEAVLAPLAMVFPGPEFAATYARLFAYLENRGDRIGTMDLLIATAALLDKAPLVTSDRRHFARIPGLELIHY